MSSISTTFKAKCLAILGALTCFAGAAANPANAQEHKQNCVAVAFPTVEGVPGDSTGAANGLRELMSSYLQGPSVKVVALEAKLASQAAEEAQAKGCEPLLTMSLVRKSGGNRGLMRALGRGASATSWRLPGGGTTASAIAHTGAAAGLEAAASLAENTKAKDEIQLQYKLQTAAGHVELGPATEHQTAKNDGEDLLTPVVTRVAEAVVRQVKK